MFGWFFKREKENFSEIHPSIKNSFHNIKQDMAEVTKWIHHFHGVTGTHQSDIQKILERLGQIEEKLDFSEQSPEQKEENRVKSESSDECTETDLKNWEQLTNSQQELAWILLRINKETPGTWLSLTRLAQEKYKAYTSQEYDKVRTTLTQYLGILEDFRYVERKRAGNQSFVRIKKTNLPQLRVPSEISFETKLTKKSKKD